MTATTVLTEKTQTRTHVLSDGCRRFLDVSIVGWGALLVCFIWLCLLPTVACADMAADAGGKVIGQVRVTGNQVVETKAILEQVRSRAGATFNQKLVDEDLRRIIVMPEIYDARWEASPGDLGVDLSFVVVEAPLIVQIEVLGAKNVPLEKIAAELKFKKGDFLDVYQVRRGVEAITELYHDKGYYFAEVGVNEQLLQRERQVSYVIREGPQVRIDKLAFRGNDSFRDGKLKGKIKTAAYFPIFQKGRLDDKQLDQDRMALEGWYRSEGYLDARVFSDKEFNEDRSRATVTFVVEEGPQYEVVEVRFLGNSVVTAAELFEAMTLKVGQVLTAERQTFAERSVSRLYGRKGYLYARISVERHYTDAPGELIAVFKIAENQEYQLGRVVIQGNHQTLDKVVRRTFDRHGFLPGGLYDADAARRAQTRLKGEGLFETVSVTPIGNEPNLRDALVEVTEARTGLLMLGVGVDTNSGVGGQISIEQRNFDIDRRPKDMDDLFGGSAFIGGGQRLLLDFRPGTDETTGRINFYEPYLFDQPYYLDVNLFLFRRGRESYLERRRGGGW